MLSEYIRSSGRLSVIMYWAQSFKLSSFSRNFFLSDEVMTCAPAYCEMIFSRRNSKEKRSRFFFTEWVFLLCKFTFKSRCLLFPGPLTDADNAPGVVKFCEGYKAFANSASESTTRSISGSGNDWPGFVVFTKTVYIPAARPNFISLGLLPNMMDLERSIEGISFFAQNAIPGLGFRFECLSSVLVQ